MKSAKTVSYAKVNLFLDIIGVRNDGYHHLEMINAKISLHDDLECELVESAGVTLSVSHPKIPTGPDNTAHKAATLFFEKTGISPAARLHIEKRIPFGAGLGGGSSNAAAVLRLLNEMHNQPLALQDLIDIGARIGADVPFFLIEGCAYVTGIGEILEPIHVAEDIRSSSFHVVLCSPDVQVSTKEAYRFWDESSEQKHSEASEFIERLECMESNTEFLLHDCLFNSFEPIIYKQYPSIQQAWTHFSDAKATKPMLSGSGSNLFSIEYSLDRAEEIVETLRQHGLKAERYELYL